MTREEFMDSLMELIGLLAEMNYSQDIIEITIGLLLPLTTPNKDLAIKLFTEIAKKKLPEKQYHYEISQVFKDLSNV